MKSSSLDNGEASNVKVASLKRELFAGEELFEHTGEPCGDGETGDVADKFIVVVWRGDRTTTGLRPAGTGGLAGGAGDS